MKSKWFKLKDEVIKYRLNGNSIRDIEKKFGIPKSTLNGWFKTVVVSDSKKELLKLRWKKSLITARKKAVIWHNKEKQKRLDIATSQANNTLNEIDYTNKETLELGLAMLYLGEGSKKGKTSLASSDPLILQFFIRAMKELYGLGSNNIKHELHLRADQDIELTKKYWSKQLNIPVENFSSISLDKRSIGRKTYEHYNGVCVLNYSNIAIQRKLVYLSRKYCEIIRDK
ncbi:MAG: hypothetical protein WCO30_02740 [bacterium]